MQTAHSDKISGLAFPSQYGEVFVTCSFGCIRVWHLHGCRELLRISLPNLECRCITFAPVSTPSACTTALEQYLMSSMHAEIGIRKQTLCRRPGCACRTDVW